MITQKKTRISAILPSHLAVEIKQASKIRKVSQSAILQKALEDWLEKKLAKDAKALSKMHFEDLPSEEEWTAIQSNI